MDGMKPMSRQTYISSKILSSVKSLRIILIYVCVSALWIFFANNILGKFLSLSEFGTWLQILKEWIYVIITSLFLYFLINRSLFLINRAKDEAEAANRLKTEFLAQMSHEIRTPLNVSLSFMGKIKWELGEKLTPELLSDFSVIEKADQRLVKTIDSILEMSQLQLGTYSSSFKYLDLVKDVLNKIEGEYTSSAEKKKLLLHFDYKIDNAIVYCDSNSISKIFTSLLDNAINYTNSGEIKLSVERNGKGNVLVSVEDTGIGIAENFLPRLFEPFSQEEQGFLRSYEGNGLGLALTKKYCDLIGAKVEVESEKGKGSKFLVTFKK